MSVEGRQPPPGSATLDSSVRQVALWLSLKSSKLTASEQQLSGANLLRVIVDDLFDGTWTRDVARWTETAEPEAGLVVRPGCRPWCGMPYISAEVPADGTHSAPNYKTGDAAWCTSTCCALRLPPAKD